MPRHNGINRPTVDKWNRNRATTHSLAHRFDVRQSLGAHPQNVTPINNFLKWIHDTQERPKQIYLHIK